MNYYNELDPKAAEWLRVLIAQGHIPPGWVDERSICDVSASELSGFTQCHFFAGIGGWPLALALAGWPEDRPVWSGSCPCQPFSDGGKRQGFRDSRHLWPVWFPLIRECSPPVVIGEQVASKIALHWLDGVFADMEGQDYACAAADLCAAGVNSPHIRQRLWWLAHSNSGRREQRDQGQRGIQLLDASGHPCGLAYADSGERPRVADGEGCQFHREAAGRQQGNRQLECGGSDRWMGNTEGDDKRGNALPREHGEREPFGGSGDSRGMGDTVGPRLEGLARHGDGGNQPGWFGADEARSASETSGARHWDDFDLAHCRDGKARRIESGTFPLAYGVSGRVGLLRGYGNAIVPPLAAEFVRAFLETEGER